MLLKKILLSALFVAIAFAALAQTCPQNVGFEDGTFNHWSCYAGNLKTATGIFTPVANRHTILKNASQGGRDQYGNFPVNCPNGSGYSIRLGNNITGAETESITYAYTIPANQQDFTLVYYYALVLQNPGHTPENQPQFKAEVADITSDQAILNAPPVAGKTDLACANHTFVSGDNSNGFYNSQNYPDVTCKAWSPVAISLHGYAGHTILMTFTTSDCALGGHFGYAYLDFNEICYPGYTGPIRGNNYCDGASSVTLTAPVGFQSYTWYDATLTTILSKNNALTLPSLPPDNTTYALVVEAPPDLGCTYTMYTTVSKVNAPYKLTAMPVLQACQADGVDITQPYITNSSSPDMYYEYFTDADTQHYIPDPKLIITGGTYYIRGTNTAGCTAVVPVEVQMNDGPQVAIEQPQQVCAPATVDITAPGIATSTIPGVVYSYFYDYTAKNPIPNPKAITAAGIYYIKAFAPGSICPVTISTVTVVIKPLPVMSPAVIKDCAPVYLNLAIAQDSRPNNKFKFYTDASLKQEIPAPGIVTQSGTYYYKAFSDFGCESLPSTIVATVYPIPDFTVTTPAPAVYPVVIDLSKTHEQLDFATFTYWFDPEATKKPVTDYSHIFESGRYFIKATNFGGCSIINYVDVIVSAPPEAGLTASNTFTPNGDGVNDEFAPVLKGYAKVNYLKIFDRYGQEVFETTDLLKHWDGRRNGKAANTGTYYWMFSCFDNYRKKVYVRSGTITVIR